MKYCDKCGYELRDEDNFCPNCGDKVSENAKDNNNQYVDEHNEFINKINQPRVETNYFNTNSENVNINNKEKAKPNVFSFISFGIGVLSLIGAIIYIIIINQRNDKTLYDMTLNDMPFYYMFIFMFGIILSSIFSNQAKRHQKGVGYDTFSTIGPLLAVLAIFLAGIGFFIFFSRIR